MVDGLRHTVVTDDDHGALLAIITWFLACALVQNSAYSCRSTIIDSSRFFAVQCGSEFTFQQEIYPLLTIS